MSFFERSSSVSTFAIAISLLAACSSKSTTAGNGAPVKGSDGGSTPSLVCNGKTGLVGVETTEIDAGGGALSYLVETLPGQDGGTREAFVHVPPGYDKTKPTELVLNFHGLLEPAQLQAEFTHMSTSADARNFIVVYPQGLSGVVGVSWNAGNCCGNPYDDMGFIRSLVKDLEEKYCVDPKRVFATGLSNGAMMSYRLACEASDVFAAVAPVAGAVEVATCSPPRPVPILAFHGTGDTIVPYNGGLDGIVHLISFPPVSYSIDLWRKIDGCSGDDTAALDAGANGGTITYSKGDAHCRSWSSCSKGSEVELCTIDDGGHAWPGGGKIIGKTSTDIDATSTILDFFDKHPMP